MGNTQTGSEAAAAAAAEAERKKQESQKELSMSIASSIREIMSYEPSGTIIEAETAETIIKSQIARSQVITPQA
jgi:hypothetical protein